MARVDELIRKDVIDQLVKDNRIDASKINVEVSNGTVTLRGEVPTYYSLSSAYEDTQGVLGVVNVRNQLVVKYPPSIPLPTDAEIEESIRNRLARNPDFDLLDTEVIVSVGLVTLRGAVDSYWKKIRAEELVAAEPGVEVIENHLAVVPTGDISDKAIAMDIVDSLEAKAAVDADDVNVRVRDGEVTLTGFVPSWSARRAAEEAVFYNAGVADVNNRLAVTGL